MNAHVVLITFAIDSPESFLNVSTKVCVHHAPFFPDIINNGSSRSQWYPEARRTCGPHVPILLVGCKSDLRDGSPPAFCMVPREEAETVAYRLNLKGYYECSSFRVEGLSEVIEEAARASLEVAHEQTGMRCVIC